MTNYSKTVLIVTNTGHQNDNIIEAFDDRGMRADRRILGDDLLKDLPDKPPNAIVFQLDHVFNELENVIYRLKSFYGDLNIPVLTLLNVIPPLQIRGADSLLLSPYHPVQIVLRTMSLIRLSEMETEIDLRLKTLEKDFNLIPDLTSPSRQDRFRILFIGKASPEFMIVINALQKKHVNITAAFTSFTAFDYLYERSFDAVVMNGLTGLEPAVSVTETMRKNAKLYHIPALLLVDGKNFGNQGTAYQAGVSDIIDINAELADISTRILEQANFHRTHANLKKEFSSLGGDDCVDKETGLYNQQFFNKHLSRVKSYYNEVNLPVSLCLVRVKAKQSHDPLSLSNAYKYFGDLVKNIVRLQDVSARLNENTFAIAFGGQDIESLKPVSKRISTLLHYAKINDLKTGKQMEIDLEINFSELPVTYRKTQMDTALDTNNDPAPLNPAPDLDPSQGQADMIAS